ncbi:TPA: DNA methyltransferase [Clostridioides difficile]|uniref:DNA methylase n=1 Tax=Clostridioides difficile TaxID=1496 RepID=UPI00038C7218|nr:DNA methylase [Clostridioides difficile]EQG74193.1 DNA methylase family protein [Clostridioides difficile DA00165]EAA0009784.1 hypothetical protein [Clostridioides difficile]EGT3780721.1 hypothetical protein [Clostridioides difficile]EGT3820001.1 hypothetical protein [Clostridioides difficile]EGT3859074.1 hypothetical protein [Clostridioides difficile]
MTLDIKPYYSSSKNVNFSDFCEKKSEGRYIDNTQLEMSMWNPYDSPIESNRGGSLYNAHSYPTKIDYKSIMKYILFHTKAGDLVLDPFSGSGTTGVAAIQCGKSDSETIKELKDQGISVQDGERKAMLVDISTLATFISSSLLTKCDRKDFDRYVNEVITETEKEISWMYKVVNREGEEEELRQVIWSEVFKCPKCGKHMTYWEAGVDQENKKFNDTLKCNYCSNEYEKSIENKVFDTKFDSIINENIETVRREPVRIYVQKGKEKYYRECIQQDKDLLKKIENYKINTVIPIVKMMFKDGNWGEMYRSGYHKGITHVHHFYTKRNLIAISTMWEKAMNTPEFVRNKILFLISSYNLSNSTLMTRAVYKSSCDDLVITGYQNGQLYLGSISVEKNVINGIKNVKLSTIKKAFDEIGWGSENIRISTQSNIKLDIPDNSVDYIFTDPPFGQDIIYSEMNFISEAWINTFTNNVEEAIICRAQNKSISEYKELLTDSFKEMYRVLKKGRSATIVFHNSKKDVWNATLEALYESGFDIVDTSILDKKQGSIKQVKSSNSVSKDIVIHALKPDYKISKLNESGLDVWRYIDYTIEEFRKNGMLNIDDIKQYLYSYYLAYAIKNKSTIEYDSKMFYKKLKEKYCEN